MRRFKFLRLKNFNFQINKRQKFVVGVIFLSLILFFSEHLLGKSGLYSAFILSFLTDVFLYWSVRHNLKDNFFPQAFILPFLYSLAFSLFYFLVPARFLTRITMTSLYAIGLYALFLSTNIFIVSSIRTIALLSSARTVAFIMTLLSYFFLSNVVFSLHLNIFPTLAFLLIFSFLLILQALWIYAFNKSLFSEVHWIAPLTLCLVELYLVLWFWPILPTIAALFMTGFFYIMVGLSQVWLEKRLFKGVLWEYVWVAAIIFIVFVFFTLRS